MNGITFYSYKHFSPSPFPKGYSPYFYIVFLSNSIQQKYEETPSFACNIAFNACRLQTAFR